MLALLFSHYRNAAPLMGLNVRLPAETRRLRAVRQDFCSCPQLFVAVSGLCLSSMQRRSKSGDFFFFFGDQTAEKERVCTFHNQHVNRFVFSLFGTNDCPPALPLSCENECLNARGWLLAGCTFNLNNQNLFFCSITSPPGGS